MNLKESLTVFFKKIKWYHLVLILIVALIGSINDMLYFSSMFLVFIFSIAIFSLKVNNKNNFLKSCGISFGYFLSVLVVQYIILIIGMLPYVILGKGISILADVNKFTTLLYSISSWKIIAIAIFLIISLMCVFLLELIKTINLINFFKTNKKKELFKIKDSLKTIFSLNYFIIVLFMLGIFVFSLLILVLIFLIFGSFLFVENISYFFIIVFVYIISMAYYYLLSETKTNKK